MLSLKDKLDKIQKKINQHPGYKASVQWTNHKRFYNGVHVKNRNAFYEHIHAPLNDDNLSIELIQNVRLPFIREKYINELFRLIHNYLTSSFTLVGHSRRLKDSYKATAFYTQYNEKIAVFNKSAIHHFIQDLRNYFVHYGVPSLGWNISLKQQSNNFELNIDKESLLEWNGWTSVTRKYLTNSDATINLIKVIEEHEKMIDELYKWLYQNFKDLHYKDIEKVNKLIQYRNRVLDGSVKDC